MHRVFSSCRYIILIRIFSHYLPCLALIILFTPPILLSSGIFLFHQFVITLIRPDVLRYGLLILSTSSNSRSVSSSVSVLMLKDWRDAFYFSWSLSHADSDRCDCMEFVFDCHIWLIWNTALETFVSVPSVESRIGFGHRGSLLSWSCFM